jgi:hypothetical protein
MNMDDKIDKARTAAVRFLSTLAPEDRGPWLPSATGAPRQ